MDSRLVPDRGLTSVCQVPCNYIPKRSNPLLQAREVLRLLAEEGIEGEQSRKPSRGATAIDKSDIITL